jgi:DNA-binding HxlR family transcriptional regulator
MKRKSYSAMDCPVALSLERVGDWWNILLIRNAFLGESRFDQFQKSLAIAPNTLTRRLNGLVDSGIFERRLYCEKPPRYEYHLTECGRDFGPVLRALLRWGEAHFVPAAPAENTTDASL